MPIASLPALVTVAIVAMTSMAAAHAQVRPASPPVRNVDDTYFGVAVADPYRYMEDLKNAEVATWIKAEADYASATLRAIPGRDALLAEITQRGDAVSARVFDVQVVGRYVYYQKRLANENIPKLYVRDGFAGKERQLVDPERIPAPEGKHSALDYYEPSNDNKYLAYGISSAGSEASVLRVLEVASGRDTGDVIDRAKFANPSWLPDDRLVYGRLQKLAPDAPVTAMYQNMRVYLHRLHTNPDDDRALFGAGVSPGVAVAPTELVYAFYPKGSVYMLALVFNGVQREIQVYAAPIAALAGADIAWTKIAGYADEVTRTAVQGDTLYLMTHKDAPRFKVVRTSLAKPDIAAAQTVVPPGEAVVTGMAAASDALYVRRMNGGNSELFRLARDASAPARVALPFVGDLDGMDTDPEQPGIVFSLGGWTRFGGYYRYEPKLGRVQDTRLQPQGKYDNPSGLDVTEAKVAAGDGTLIPMSIVHRKGLKLDGSNPTIVYGYGAYGISQTPFFRPTWLPWFDRGGVLAVTHVRGGGEFGEDWHKAGYQATKPNTWRDAIACANWLVANGYTSSPRMSIMGGSAGGIFVGRAITERPELFGAAVDQVPMSDVVRAEFSANGVPNIPEFGTVKTEDGFRALHAMSPYHWVKDGVAYPAVLLTTGFNDPRVDAWEAAKMAARLQAASTGGKPVLLRVDYDAGHGFGSTKKQAYEERADTFAFLFWQAGVKGFRP